MGSIGEDSRDRLVDSGILDHKKEMLGLNRGSTNIINRYGAEVTTMDSAEAQKHLTHMVNKSKDARGLSGIARAYGAQPKDLVDQTMAGFNASEGHMTFLQGDKPRVNVGKNIPAILDTGDAKDSKYTHALIHHHEADELRYGTQAMHNPKTSVDIKGAIMPTTRFGQTGHMSAKVIAQESAHLAITPSPIRAKWGEGRVMGGEAKAMRHYSKGNTFDYAFSGKPDMRTAQRVDKAWSAVNKPELVRAKGLVDAIPDPKPGIFASGINAIKAFKLRAGK